MRLAVPPTFPTRWGAILGAALCLALGMGLAPALADDPADSLAQWRLGGEVAAWARRARDPLGLLTAARMRREAGLSARARRTALTPGEAAALGEPSALIAEARRMAAGRPAVEALADDLDASREKGREQGPLYEIIRLGPKATESRAGLAFGGGRRAEIYVEGGGRFALRVTGADGRRLCGPPPSEVAYCWWSPDADVAVRVEIVNEADAAVTVRLVTN